MNRTLLSWTLLAVLSACASRALAPAAAPITRLPPPVASKVDAPPASRSEAVQDDYFGQKVSDPYRWLEDEKSPEVQAWMKAQDGYARAHLSEFPGRDTLEARLRALSFVEAVQVPVQRAQRLFFLRRPSDKNKPLLYVREAGKERVLLDPNEWNNGTTSLGTWVPSWDGKKVAFLKRPNAADDALLNVVDVATGEVSATDVIDGARYATPSWTPDGKALYYVHLTTGPAMPAAEEPAHVDVRRHVLGQDPKRDVVVHPESGDATAFIWAELTRDGKFLIYEQSRGLSDDRFSLMRVGKDGRFHEFTGASAARYAVHYWKGQLYIETSDGASREHLFRVSAEHPERKNWKEIVPEDPSSLLRSFAVAGNHLVLSYLNHASSELRIADLDGRLVRTASLPGLGTVAAFSGLEDQDSGYFTYEDFTTPREVLETSISSGKTHVWAKGKVPVDPSHYTVRQVSYPSKDGTAIPMFLVQRKDVTAGPKTPTLLYGYGGFNIPLTPSYSPMVLTWLDAGGVYAMANLRGGGEFGEAWHAAGSMHQKQNVFDDFAAAAGYLVRENLTSPAKLGIYGKSNGGLLVGAAMVQHPELYAAVVCGVPILDAVRSERFGGGRTWTPEYGTVTKEEDFKAIYAYSPYHHVQSGVRYPELLMMSSDHDDRVDPLHARKFVAAVQSANPHGAPAYLRIEAHAGHHGAERVEQGVRADVDLLAFLTHALNVTPPPTHP